MVTMNSVVLANNRNTRTLGWGLPAALIVFVTVPVLAGMVRLVELARGAEITAANARFFASPVPVVLHIVAVTLFTVAGAFQFVPRLRRGAWHRRAGRVIIAAALVASLTGLWMSAFYRPIPHDNDLLFAFRLFFGGLMTTSIVLSFAAVRRRDIPAHSAWIIRAYAIGLGAATQALDHLPWVIAGRLPDDFTRSLLMGGAWVVNLAVAEYLIRRRRSQR